MQKRARKKQTKSAKNLKKETPAPKADDAQGDDKKPFDFGGFPARDLKKNLGCG